MCVHISRRSRHSRGKRRSEEASIASVFPVADEELGLMGKKQIPSIGHRHSSAERTRNRRESEASVESSSETEKAWTGEERRSARRDRSFALPTEEDGRVEETDLDGAR